MYKRGLNKDLYYKHRFEFCELLKTNPEFFENLAIETLRVYNDYYTNLYSNFIGSNVYNEHKTELYEMMFSTYSQIRIANSMSKQSIKDGETTIKEFLSYLKSKVSYNMMGFYKSKFRNARIDMFCLSAFYYLGVENCESRKEAINRVGERLNDLACSKNGELWEYFKSLPEHEKNKYLILEMKKSLKSLSSKAMKTTIEKKEEVQEN